MPHVPTSGGSSDYGTPPGLFAHFNRRFVFDYDPFAAIDNRMPVRFFSTPEGTFEALGDDGRVEQISDLDGLRFPWAGRRVFFNPPYRPQGVLAAAVAKAGGERDAAEVILGILPVDSSTAWWQELLLGAHLEFLQGRPSFVDYATRRPKTNSTVSIVGALWRPSPDAWRAP